MKGLIILYITILFLLSNDCMAQPDTLWTRVYGGEGYDWGYSVQQTADSGFIIMGQTNSFGEGNLDFWLLKTNANGDTLWTKTYGGNEDDEGWCVHQTLDGGFIMSGHTESFGLSEDDFWIVKTDSQGVKEWDKMYGGDEDNDKCVLRETLDKGYILLGASEVMDTGNDDVLLVKINDKGDIEWSKTFGDSLHNEVGSIDVTSDSGFIITFTYEEPDSRDQNIQILKTDSLGNIKWTKNMGGSENETIAPNSVKQTSDGGYVIFATTESFGSGGEDIWLVKTDEQGETLWTKTFGGFSTDFCIGGDQTLDGGYIVLARTTSFGAGNIDAWLIQTDQNGEILWTKTFGGTGYDVGACVRQTFDGGYIISGATQSFAANLIDLWLIRLEPYKSTGLTENKGNRITSFELKQNYPNPFNPTTTMRYDLPKAQFVTIGIYNTLGQKLETLLNKRMPAGNHEIQFNGQHLPSGVYLYRIEAGEWQEVKKMVLLK
jgi:hypothetical protein